MLSATVVNVPSQVVDVPMTGRVVSDAVESNAKPCATMASEDISGTQEASSVTINSGLVPDINDKLKHSTK